MSRSRPPKCPAGRGCWVCQDPGLWFRRRREKADERAAHSPSFDAIDLELLEMDWWYSGRDLDLDENGDIVPSNPPLAASILERLRVVKLSS